MVLLRGTTGLALAWALVFAGSAASCKSNDRRASAQTNASSGGAGAANSPGGATNSGAPEGGTGGASVAGGGSGPGVAGASSDGGSLATTAGAGGTAVGLDAYPWVDDPSAWRSPTEAGPCRPSSALITKLDFPGSEWTNCGDGCRRLKPIKGPAGLIGDNYFSGMRVRHNVATLWLSMGLLTEPRLPLLGLFELEDELVPKAFMKQTASGCSARFLSGNSPVTVSNVVSDTPDGTLEKHIGRIEIAEDGLIRWLEPHIDQSNFEGFDFDDGWGGIWSKKVLTIATGDSSSEQTELYASNGNIVEPHSNGRRVVFGEWRGDDTGAVLSWSPGSTVVDELVAGPWDVMDLALSETTVVWLAATGPQTWEGAYDSATLRWMDFETQQYDADHALVLPITRARTELATNDGWVSLGGCEGDVCGIYLVNLATKELWRQRPASDHVWTNFGLVDERLFISDSEPGTPPGYFSSLVEYRFEAFTAGADTL